MIAVAQLMIVLDITIVNIALPSAQRDLGISNADRQWVITAYTLAFGGLLLLGGRLGDLYGRKRTFMIGLLGFAAASALGGSSVSGEMLFASRALQGAFGALLAPSALGLLSTTFSSAAPKERATAFGIFGGIAGGGSAIGFIAGGLLTEYLSWRWCLFVNVPIALCAALGAFRVLHRDHIGKGARIPLDLRGVFLGCGGLLAIVYGTSEAESRGWSSSLVLACLALGGAMLIAFVFAEKHSDHALLPIHIVADRNRGGAALSVGLSVVGLFGLFLFLTYYLQVVKGYSPLKTGIAFLPMTVAIVSSSTGLAARLMNRVPSRNLIVPGLLLAAGGMAWLTQLKVGSSYVSTVLPAEILLGVGMGLVFMPSMSLATLGWRHARRVPPRPPSTPPSRWADRSVPRCSTPSRPPRPRPIWWAGTRAATWSRTPPACTATPWPPRSRSPSCWSRRCSPSSWSTTDPPPRRQPAKTPRQRCGRRPERAPARNR